MRKPGQAGYVETRDNTIHPIQYVEDVPVGNDDKQTYIKNDLHVPTITKNLVSVGQIVEQGMQVRFIHKRVLYMKKVVDLLVGVEEKVECSSSIRMR